MSERCLKHAMQIAGILALAGMNVQAAHDLTPVDVTVCVTGDAPPPLAVENWAKAAVTSMYARIGVHLAWSNSAQARGRVSGGPLSIEIRFVSENSKIEHPDALAFALPFAGGANTITVMYRRIQTASGGAGRGHQILAHVLAHEIGHVLQGIDWHSQTGLMKARWDGLDFDAMQKKPLEFTPDDVDLIVRGLAGRKSQIAASTRRADIVHLAGQGSK